MDNHLIQATEHLVGFLVVVAALMVLWGLTALIGKVLSKSKMEITHAQPAVESIGAPGDEEEELVVVAAAAAQMLSERHRIVSIRPQYSSWGQQGRREIHASRNIR